jgi:glycerol-3-phosphate dehydrogenase
MRIGLREMRAFSKLLFPSVRDNTFFESCGVADLITTCRTYIHRSQLTIEQKNS